MRRYLGHGIAFADGDPASSAESLNPFVQPVAITRQAEIAEQLQPAPGWELPAERMRDRLFRFQGAAHHEAEDGARRVSELRPNGGETGRQPLLQLARTGSLARSIATYQRHDSPAARRAHTGREDRLADNRRQHFFDRRREHSGQPWPARVRQQPAVQLPWQGDPFPRVAALTQPAHATLEERHVDRGEMLLQDPGDCIAITTVRQIVQLNLCSLEPAAGRQPPSLPQNQPEDEDQELELQRGNPEEGPRLGGLENWQLQRQPKGRSPVVADNQPVVHVKVQEARHPGVVSEIVLDAGQLPLPR